MPDSIAKTLLKQGDSPSVPGTDIWFTLVNPSLDSSCQINIGCESSEFWNNIPIAGIVVPVKVILKERSDTMEHRSIVSAVDVSKDTLECAARYGRDEMKPFSVPNSAEGLKLFWAQLQLFQKRCRCDSIMLGFESSGVYTTPLINFFRGKDILFVQVNPNHTKRVKELVDNSPGKTDPKDTAIIMDLLQMGRYLSVITPTGPAAGLRALIHARENQMRQHSIFLNQLEALSFRLCPELKPNLYTQSGRRQLKRATSRRSKNPLGTCEGLDAIRTEIKYLLRQAEQTEIFIKSLEGKMETEIEKIDYAKNLRTIKGIGTITLAGIIGEVGDFKFYRSAKEIIKLSGFNLFEISSGKKRGDRHISRRGRWLLRKILYFAAMNISRNPGRFREFYQKLIKAGKPKIKALIAVACKLIAVMFALVRDKSYYDNRADVTPNPTIKASLAQAG